MFDLSFKLRSAKNTTQRNPQILFPALTRDGQLPAVLNAALPGELVRGPAAQELARVLDTGEEDHGTESHIPIRTRLEKELE